MKWDNDNDRPITAEELDLDELLEENDLDWVAHMDAVDILFQSRVEVTLTRPSLLQKVSNNPLLGEADSVQTFYKVTDLPTDKDGDNSAHRDAEMGDTSVAGDLEGSSAGAV
jgi:hypothetical protein